MTPENDSSARARLIRTRRGAWIDKGLLPAARRECLEVLRRAVREAVGEDTYIPGWIADRVEDVEWRAEEISFDRIYLKPTPAREKMEREIDKVTNTLYERGAFEGLTEREQWDFEGHIRKSISSKYKDEDLYKKPHIPKSNPSLVTEGELLDFGLDSLHRWGVLDAIIDADLLRAPVEEDDAYFLARRARKTAGVCGCCGRELSTGEPAHFGARVYVGMWSLYWDKVSKPQICKLRYEPTVLCRSCAPEWLSPERYDVVTQLCAHCERPMISRLELSSLRRTFCSERCQRTYHNQLRKQERAEKCEKVCEVCGEEFTATRRDTKTCSKRCKQKAYRQRKKELRE